MVASDLGSKYLTTDERPVLRVRRHYTVLAGPFAAAVGGIAAAALLGYLTGPDSGADVIDTVAGLAAAFLALRFCYRAWEWWDNRLVVTDQRVVEISGVVTRRVASMPLAKVTDMTYRRSLLGRLLGYGDLILESAGQRQALSSIDHIPHPDDFYRTVTALLAAQSGAPPPPARARDDDEDDTGPLPRVIV